MMLILHIVIALLSLVLATYLMTKPTQRRFFVTYALMGLTVVTGTFLTLTQPAHLLQACAAGLAYSSFSLVMVISARRKLAKATASVNLF